MPGKSILFTEHGPPSKDVPLKPEKSKNEGKKKIPIRRGRLIFIYDQYGKIKSRITGIL